MRTLIASFLSLLPLLIGACSPATTPPSERVESTSAAGTKSSRRKPSLEELGFSDVNTPGVKWTAHRVGAGEFDDTGWCRATSTEGGFSVSLPGPFADLTMTMSAEDKVDIHTYILGAQDENKVRFTVAAMWRADGKFKGGDFLENFTGRLERQGELKEKRAISLGELKGVEGRAVNRGSSAAFRIYAGTNIYYNLMVECMGSTRPKGLEKDERRFFDSFTVPEKKNPR